MPHTFGAAKVLLDAGPFFRFCDGGQILNLAQYLGQRAFITLEVKDELERNAQTYVDLRTLQLARWPSENNELELPTALKQELRDLARGLQVAGDHPNMHFGEISTVLMAEHLGGELILLDDNDGKRLARARNVPRLSTAMLAAEMVACNAIGEPEGFKVYDAATPDGIGQNQWLNALARAAAVVPPTEASSGPAT
ncbi:MAG: hypothetical protein WBD40_19060 [Tepidisphaeraceae bacterium]